jgi:hypothetical protein
LASASAANAAGALYDEEIGVGEEWRSKGLRSVGGGERDLDRRVREEGGGLVA